MGSYVLGFNDIDKTKIMVAGGKGANLGELSRIEGVCVPVRRWFTHRRQEFCSLSTPSLSTGRCFPLTPASDSERPWSPAW